MRLQLRFLIASIAVGLGAAGVSTSSSLDCTESPSICNDFDRSSLVFFGRVEAVTPDAAERQIEAVRPQTVSFEVLEGFKALTAGYTTLTFNTAAPDERVFSRGETVLVYARRSASPELSSVACSRTRRIQKEDPEVGALRELAAGSPGAAVEGALRPLAGPQPPAPAPTVTFDRLSVTAESLDRADVATVSSGTGGYFLFPWLQPGRYRIRLDSDLYVPITRDVTIATRARCSRLEPFTMKLR